MLRHRICSHTQKPEYISYGLYTHAHNGAKLSFSEHTKRRRDETQNTGPQSFKHTLSNGANFVTFQRCDCSSRTYPKLARSTRCDCKLSRQDLTYLPSEQTWQVQCARHRQVHNTSSSFRRSLVLIHHTLQLSSLLYQALQLLIYSYFARPKTKDPTLKRQHGAT